MTSGAGHGAAMQGQGHGRRPVLEVFGLELEVSNARLADLLTMDAKSALTTDVRDLVPDAESRAAPPICEGPPDAPSADAQAAFDEAAALRQRFRRCVLETGIALGFEVAADGTWRSPLGVTILTRSFEKCIDEVMAAHYVGQLASRAGAGEDAMLLVAEEDTSVAAFAAAIRAGRLHERFRVISAAGLAEIRALSASGLLDHRRALVLLAPVADVDGSELLALLRPDPRA